MGTLLQGVEKLISSKMLLEGSNRRIHAVDRHAGMVSSPRSNIRALLGCPSFNIYIVSVPRPLYGHFLLKCTKSRSHPLFGVMSYCIHWLLRFLRRLLGYAHVQAMAGLASDGRQIVTKARSEASNYRRYFRFLNHNLSRPLL